MNNIQVTDFYEDVEKAESIELEVLKLIQKKYKNAFKKPGNFKFYDIEVPGVTTIEIKHDMRSDETDNLFIEKSFNGEPSGLDASTAEWWCFVDKNGYFFIKREALNYIIRENRCFTRHITGSDGTKIEYILIKKDKIILSPFTTFIKRG